MRGNGFVPIVASLLLLRMLLPKMRLFRRGGENREHMNNSLRLNGAASSLSGVVASRKNHHHSVICIIIDREKSVGIGIVLVKVPLVE